jgi:hypothetical protein
MSKVLPKSLRIQAVLFSAVYTQRQISMMLNPANRGPNWNWENFPEWVSSGCEKSLAFSFTDNVWKKWGKELQMVARDTAISGALEFLEESGILSWQHKLA